MPGPMRNAQKVNSRAHRPATAAVTQRGGIVELPATGCSLPVPDVPEGREWSPAELKLWEDIWQSPQATQYDDSYTPAVAAYVCHAQAIYTGTAAAWQAQEFRHLGDRLGLTPAGMASLGWKIVE